MKTWFFQKKNKEIFAVDREDQASIYFYGDKNNRPLKYIGWSDGQEFKKEVRKGKNLSQAQLKKRIKKNMDQTQDTPILDQARQSIIKGAWKKEIQVAKDNPDKTPPRNFQHVSYKTGQPLEQGQKMFIQSKKF